MERETRGNITYNFDTDIVHLGTYSNSSYFTGAKLWNDLPFEIKNENDKNIFSTLIKRHLHEKIDI